jgi:hypothetical protein
MKPVFFLLWASLSLGLMACQSSAEAEPLCDCLHTDANGQWDMQLSQECMAMCVEKFGPELKGMEAWFQANCDYSFEHPEVEQGPPVEQAVWR